MYIKSNCYYCAVCT